jgi:hypothetical protein
MGKGDRSRIYSYSDTEKGDIRIPQLVGSRMMQKTETKQSVAQHILSVISHIRNMCMSKTSNRNEMMHF